MHCENGLFMTLFGLLMWDVLFLPLPDVFQSQYQVGCVLGERLSVRVPR